MWCERVIGGDWLGNVDEPGGAPLLLPACAILPPIREWLAVIRGTCCVERGRTALIVVGLVVALVPSTALASVKPVAVVTGPQDQWQAFADEAAMAWTTNSVAHPHHWNAAIQPIAGGLTRWVNAKGTMGFAGNFDPGTDHLIYAQWTRSDVGIYLDDASSHTRKKVRGVNSAKPEWQPKISHTFILFRRDHTVNGKWYTSVLLYVRATQRTRTLGTWPSSRVIYTGNVGDCYATFFVGSNKGYSPFLYDSKTRIRTKIPSTQPWAWAPARRREQRNRLLRFDREPLRAEHQHLAAPDLADRLSDEDRRPAYRHGHRMGDVAGAEPGLRSGSAVRPVPVFPEPRRHLRGPAGRSGEVRSRRRTASIPPRM